MFTPTPNAVTEVTANLAVSTQRSINGASGRHDIVAVTGAGAGQLPIASVGPHTTAAGQLRETPTMQIFYPKIQPGGSNNNNYDYPNYVVLMQYDWCDGGAASSRAKASQACGAIVERPRINRQGKPVASVSKSVNMADGKSAKVTLKLAKKARKRVPRKSNRVSVKLSLGKTLGTVKKNLTLKR